MGIFIGDQKRSKAAKCCLRMHWAFLNLIRPPIEAKYPDLKEKGYTLEHSAGVDIGTVMVVRAGVRNSNDLVSIGGAPNIAARLSDLREAPYRSFITAPVYDLMMDSSKLAWDGKNMWESRSLEIKGKKTMLYRSKYTFSL